MENGTRCPHGRGEEQTQYVYTIDGRGGDGGVDSIYEYTIDGGGGDGGVDSI